MTDPKPEGASPSIVTDDLRIIVEGSERKLFVKDKTGKQRRCYPLAITEFLEFERELGVSIFDIWNSRIKLQHIVFLLWLSLRKEGCSVEDLKRRNFKLTQTDIHEMFDGAFLTSSVETFVSILSISGFGKSAKKDPQTPASPDASGAEKDSTHGSAETS